MTDTNRQHLTSLRIVGDVETLPSHAELIRTLLRHGGFGTLTTTTPDGHPYGSLVAYSVRDDGSPLVCISDLAEHTRFATAHPAAGLFVAGPTPSGGDPMDAPRVSLVGELRRCEPTPADVERHLDQHPGAGGYADWSDFGWWTLQVASGRFVGGFGIMSWVDADEIASAVADPIAATSLGAVEHMNVDHLDASLSIVRTLGRLPDATSARVRDIDRMGVTFAADAPAGWHFVRVVFPDGPLSDPAAVRGAVVELTRRARAMETEA
ncbi:MAG: hypothetical protein CL424_18525 [Acidimicrobiaceae bacterium]|nr:hypothetical protein [Acidimicrobiaceae bacterium]